VGVNPLRLALALAVWASIASLPAAAEALTIAPPGNAGIDQYKEKIPGPGGSETARPGESQGPPPAPAAVLGKRNAEKLSRLGADGRAAARLAARTASARTAAARHAGKNPAAQADRAAAGGSGSSGLLEVVAQATGSSSSGEMGLLLPLIIAAAVVGAVAYAVTRRRSTPDS
jgi:hypothetical protein